MTHTVEVTASTVYEAVAHVIAALRGHDWVAGIPHGPQTVKVAVAHIPVEHEIRMADFEKWLEQPSRSPRETIARQKIRAILGMPVSR